MKGRKRESYALFESLIRPSFAPVQTISEIREKSFGRRKSPSDDTQRGRPLTPDGGPSEPIIFGNKIESGQVKHLRDGTGGVRQTPYGASAVEGRDLTLRPRIESEHPSCSPRRSARLN
ncbi:hypothetical protein CDAR_114691 [Caerostris darwini]|uniref:Uncharacterized protein n=1 Tax=Caerostris darwini TaxID=1538125 RepID=A0AAV4MGB1_9ARAC|nr:hypothetical protein CDAR_114691 [Caerostris darwini]